MPSCADVEELSLTETRASACASSSAAPFFLRVFFLPPFFFLVASGEDGGVVLEEVRPPFRLTLGDAARWDARCDAGAPAR